jgi:hypothetical protein
LPPLASFFLSSQKTCDFRDLRHAVRKSLLIVGERIAPMVATMAGSLAGLLIIGVSKMPFTRQTRKKQLERMTRDAIISAWQKVAAQTGLGSTPSTPAMIDEILKKEFPPDDANLPSTENTNN